MVDLEKLGPMVIPNGEFSGRNATSQVNDTRVTCSHFHI